MRDGGLCTLAFDTELFGHHWHEGPAFLAAFVQACADLALPLVPLDDALADAPSAPWPQGLDAATSWGQPPTLWTWSGPQVADMARAQRDGELRVVARGSGVPERAVRELLALQASDWPFLETRALAGPYARERFAGHLRELDAALAGAGAPDPAVREPGAAAADRAAARAVKLTRRRSPRTMDRSSMDVMKGGAGCRS